ncbi:ZDHHC16 family protein [Megaselia abdita]
MLRLPGKLRWRVWDAPRTISSSFWENLKLCFNSLTYNHHMNSSYASDVCMEPIFWFVDNYTHLLGPFFVVGVFFLTSSVVFIAYWIGLPYYQENHPNLVVILVIIGNWLLLNVIFHYYKAVTTPPGYPPEELIPETVSICKKCIIPKPPRTHHCSVCNKCILKMDHHCPWLNNCVGYGNHRFFFLYMAYTTLGCIFLVFCGIEIAYFYVWLGVGDSWTETEPLVGHPVTYNDTGHMVPGPILEQYDDVSIKRVEHDLPVPPEEALNSTKRKAVIFVAFIVTSVILALGSLTIWHSRLITRGETSIESYVNQSEAKKFLQFNMEYVNPYNFGRRKNWILFLGLVRGRTFFRHILFPSNHKPEGNGLTFPTVHDNKTHKNEWP